MPKQDVETYLTWSDDGIHIQCENRQCVSKGEGAFFWLSDTLPWKLTGTQALAAVSDHIATHKDD